MLTKDLRIACALTLGLAVQRRRQAWDSDARPGHGTAPGGATRPPLPRPGGSVDRGDRSSAGTRRSDHQSVSLRSNRREGTRGQGALPGSVSRLRGAHRATERQGRRLRVLQTLPSRRDRSAMETGTGSRSNARMASALRRCAVLVRLVAHARTPAWRRSAQTTTSRRMARTVHCHRSVRGLGGGPRRRLRRRLNASASIPLIHGPLGCAWSSVNRGAEDRRRRYGHSSLQQQQRGRRRWVTAGQGSDSDVRLQAAADRPAGKHIDDARNRGKAGALADATSRSGRERRRETRDWRIAGRSPSVRRDPHWCSRRYVPCQAPAASLLRAERGRRVCGRMWLGGGVSRGRTGRLPERQCGSPLGDSPRRCSMRSAGGCRRLGCVAKTTGDY